MRVTKAGKRKQPARVPAQMDIFELRKKLALLKQGKLLTPHGKPKKRKPRTQV